MSNETAQATGEMLITVSKDQQRKLNKLSELMVKNDAKPGTIDQLSHFVFRKGLEYVCGAQLRLFEMHADKELRNETERLLRLLLNKTVTHEAFSKEIEASKDRLSVEMWKRALA